MRPGGKQQKGSALWQVNGSFTLFTVMFFLIGIDKGKLNRAVAILSARSSVF